MHLSARVIAVQQHANSVLLSLSALENAIAWRGAACQVASSVGADGSCHVLPLASEQQIAAGADIESVLAAIFPPPPWVGSGAVTFAHRASEVAWIPPSSRLMSSEPERERAGAEVKRAARGAIHG